MDTPALSVDNPTIGPFRTRPRLRCVVCNSAGHPLYEGVPDLMLGIPGRWRVVRCSNRDCRTLWLDPAPLREDLPNAYANYLTHEPGRPIASGRGLRDRLRRAHLQRALGYAENATKIDRLLARVAALMPVFRQSVEREVMFVPFRAGGRLLEVGCGNGRQLERLVRAGWQAQGVDFDPAAVNQARALGLEVRLGDIAEQGYADHYFDAVVASHVVEHVPEPAAFLRECRRILGPDGYLVLLTPNASALGHRIFGAAWAGLDPPRHLCVFTGQALGRLAAEAGFAVRSVRPRWLAAAGWFLASRLRQDAARRDSFASLPAVGSRIPLTYWLLGLVEGIGDSVGLSWGEELVLIAQPSRRGPG